MMLDLSFLSFGGVLVLGLVILYLVVRLVSAAFYKSREEYEKRKGEEDGVE